MTRNLKVADFAASKKQRDVRDQSEVASESQVVWPTWTNSKIDRPAGRSESNQSRQVGGKESARAHSVCQAFVSIYADYALHVWKWGQAPPRTARRAASFRPEVRRLTLEPIQELVESDESVVIH
jgi:hypothetical protein